MDKESALSSPAEDPTPASIQQAGSTATPGGTPAKASIEEWLGRSETRDEVITDGPALAAAAVLDDTTTPLGHGLPLPPLWHWFYFLPKAPQALIGPDGHPVRGSFYPALADLPRRMFAGARLRFLKPLIIGRPATKVSVVRSISEKSGKSGRLGFVTVSHAVAQDGMLCVEEEQDIVYREASNNLIPAPKVVTLPPVADDVWLRMVKPDPVLLFRFSAITFNSHRIHYDRDYATQVEGYPALVVHGPLTAMLLIELVRRNANRTIAGYRFRALAPLFDCAPFRLVGTAQQDHVALEAQGPDGVTAMAASATLAG